MWNQLEEARREDVIYKYPVEEEERGGLVLQHEYNKKKRKKEEQWRRRKEEEPPCQRSLSGDLRDHQGRASNAINTTQPCTTTDKACCQRVDSMVKFLALNQHLCYVFSPKNIQPSTSYKANMRIYESSWQQSNPRNPNLHLLDNRRQTRLSTTNSNTTCFELFTTPSSHNQHHNMLVKTPDSG